MNFEFADKDLKGERSTNQSLKYALGLIRRWLYILGFLILCLTGAVLINRYSTPIYLVQARITTSKFSKDPYSPVPGLVDASFFLQGYTDVFEEIPMLKSRDRIEEAVSKIDYHISYFSKGWIKTVEDTKGNGFVVKTDTLSENGSPMGIPIYVNQIDLDRYQLKIEEDNWESINSKTFQYGERVNLGNAIIRVMRTNGKIIEQDKYFFVLNRKSKVVDDFRARLFIDWALKGSSMLDVSIRSHIPERDIQFLNAFYEITTMIGLRDKNETLDNTIRFIDSQMKLVNDSVIYYQGIIDKLKLDNVKLNLGTEYIFSKFDELDKKKAEIAMLESYLRYLEDYFKNHLPSEMVFAPSVMELDVPLLEEWVNQYIDERLAERAIKTSENELNPLVIREDSIKRKLINGIYESIASTRARSKAKLSEIEKEANILYASVKDVQIDFRDLTKLQRLLQLNTALFDLFIKRRTEAAISKASATSDYKIIDQPYNLKQPVSPDKKLNLIIATVIGLIFPLGFFLIRDTTNSRISDKDELTSIIDMPVLGSIPHSPYAALPTIADHPRSVVAESFRAIRANLKFISPSKTGCTSLLVTSSIAGEGKTFCSLNLAQSLVMARKKTLLIGADMRKPNIKKYIDIGHEHGLSEYLAGIIPFESLITHGESQLPDVINAGSIPPNPAELLVNPRMGELMKNLQQVYEYIIIDTSPIGLVSDALELLKYTDYNLFVVRQEVTHKGALRMINEIYLEEKIKNFTIIFNDVKIRKSFSSFGGYLYGMGYDGYGYGYYEEDNGVAKRKGKR